MSKFNLKAQASELRRKGESVTSIARLLKISKGTASVWCRDIVLTSIQKEQLKRNSIEGGHIGRMRGAEVNRQKKLKVIDEANSNAKKEIGVLTKRDHLMLATALYWAEGGKTGSQFIFVNSDPKMVEMMYNFLTCLFHIEKDRISLTIQINEVHRPRMGKIIAYWSDLLAVPHSQFSNSYYIQVKPKKVYENYDTYYGIVRVRVLRGSGLQYQMLGYIDALKGQHLLM